MADQPSSSSTIEYFEDEPSSYSVVQKPSILYNYKTNQSGAQFHISFDEHEEDGDMTSPPCQEFDPPTPVPFQRVSSEDELNFYVKHKRAKFIGPYLFGDVIGQGSYAKVKECLDRRNLCRRAVKIMQRRRLRKTPHGEQMAATEIRLLKKLHHPNVIRLYDFIRNDEKQKLYLFIDLCVVSLQEMMDTEEQQTKAFPIWQAHGYFVQLIQGLEYLHSKFIIHNDIKPGNLLITVDHQLKISDFGTAEQLDMFSPDDTIKRSQGTPAFQCPEIANGEDTYSGYSIDIWSCGVTLYNLVTGRLPFEADNIYLLFQTIGIGSYTIPNELEPHLTSLIHGLLHIDKNSRLKLEQIKQHEWFRRRPSRTFEYVPFPPLALNRFQTFTLSDYLTELHQSTSLADNNHQDEPPIILTNGSNSTSATQRVQQNGRSTLNCSCSRTMSGDQIPPPSTSAIKTRQRNPARICSLS